MRPKWPGGWGKGCRLKMFWLLVRKQLGFAFQRKVLLFVSVSWTSYEQRQLLVFLPALLSFAVSAGNFSTQILEHLPLFRASGSLFLYGLGQRHLRKHKGVPLGLATQPGSGLSGCLAAKATSSISPSCSPRLEQKFLFFSQQVGIAWILRSSNAVFEYWLISC